MIGFLAGTATAPQAVADVGQRCFSVGQGEVDHSRSPGWRAVRDHIVVGEIAVDDQPGGAQVSRVIEVMGELAGMLAEDGCPLRANSGRLQLRGEQNLEYLS